MIVWIHSFVEWSTHFEHCTFHLVCWSAAIRIAVAVGRQVVCKWGHSSMGENSLGFLRSKNELKKLWLWTFVWLNTSANMVNALQRCSSLNIKAIIMTTWRVFYEVAHINECVWCAAYGIEEKCAHGALSHVHIGYFPAYFPCRCGTKW